LLSLTRDLRHLFSFCPAIPTNTMPDPEHNPTDPPQLPNPYNIALRPPIKSYRPPPRATLSHRNSNSSTTRPRTRLKSRDPIRRHRCLHLKHRGHRRRPIRPTERRSRVPMQNRRTHKSTSNLIPKRTSKYAPANRNPGFATRTARRTSTPHKQRVGPA
jgi:hypothetical protein